MELTLCYRRESYFLDHPDYQKILDPGNICVRVTIDNNCYYIPLRNNLGDEVRKFGRIGHATPSAKRRNAGLYF